MTHSKSILDLITFLNCSFSRVTYYSNIPGRRSKHFYSKISDVEMYLLIEKMFRVILFRKKSDNYLSK